MRSFLPRYYFYKKILSCGQNSQAHYKITYNLLLILKEDSKKVDNCLSFNEYIYIIISFKKYFILSLLLNEEYAMCNNVCSKCV